jgi:hypothetical protein
MLTKKSLSQLRLVLQRVASQTTMAFSHCYESLESFLKAKWHMIRPPALPFGRLWYAKPDDAIGYAKFRSRSHDAVIRVYDDAGNVIETYEHAGDFKEW